MMSACIGNAVALCANVSVQVKMILRPRGQGREFKVRKGSVLLCAWMQQVCLMLLLVLV